MGSLGLFSHHTFETERFSILVGGRYSRTGIHIPDQEFGEVNLVPQSLVGHFSFQAKAGNFQRIVVSANTGFRAPNVNDISTLGLFDYGIEVPATGLEPEKSATIEAGYKLLTKRINASVFLFHTRLTDQIERVRSTWQGSDSIDGQPVYKKQNLSRSAISGVEIEGAVKMSEAWSVHAGFTWLYGENLDTREPMRRIPPANGKVALLYERGNFYVESGFLWATIQDRLSQGDKDDYRIPEGGTPGWTVVNLSGGYSWPHLGLYGGLINIFNSAYRTHGSGTDGMGRSAWLSLRVKI
jgi:outer membrane receptor protein involved in Fe transport